MDLALFTICWQVLSEQPPDTWDSFPLFQILNDYLRTDGNVTDGQLYQHELLVAENIQFFDVVL